LVLAPGDDLARLAIRRNPPDVILGVPRRVCDDLARRGLLEQGPSGQPSWRVVSRSRLHYLLRPDATPPGSPGEVPAGLAFNDPRRDPLSLAWAQAVLGSGPWADGYGRLVLAARGQSRPGRQPHAALAQFSRGDVVATLVERTDTGDPGHPLDGSRLIEVGRPDELEEGVVALRSGRHASEARALIDDAALRLDTPTPRADVPEAGALLADLLGSTLVDAHDELRDAWETLDRSRRPARALAWMTEPPPWPPVSVARILDKGPSAMPLLETLAAQLCPEADARGWLLRSWIAPPRLIDGAVLDELAAAADGRLVRETRFRAWLRAEWTASARQRYRRVARQVLAGGAS
jgi:hypothetical protein